MGLKVASIGAGYFSRFHHEAWARIPEVTLVGAADLDPGALRARAPGVPHFSDAAEMIARTGPDLVDIVTPPATHREMIRAAITEGARAAICQKPFTTGLAEAEATAAEAAHAGLTLVVHENFRFQPWYRELRAMIDAGRLGEILQITFRLRPGDGRGPRAYLDRQPYFREMERFLIHETGVHWIDTFRYLLGRPESVWADLRRLNPAIAGEDAGIVIFGYPDGRRAIFDGNRLADHPAENRRRTMGESLIEGTAMTALLDGEGRIWLRAFGSNEWGAHGFAAPETGFGGDCVHALQSHVVAGLLHGAPLENRAEDYLDVIRIEEAIYESDASGRRITLQGRDRE